MASDADERPKGSRWETKADGIEVLGKVICSEQRSKIGFRIGEKSIFPPPPDEPVAAKLERFALTHARKHGSNVKQLPALRKRLERLIAADDDINLQDVASTVQGGIVVTYVQPALSKKVTLEFVRFPSLPE